MLRGTGDWMGFKRSAHLLELYVVSRLIWLMVV